MAKKTIDWMKKALDGKIQQFDQFTLKLGSYKTLFGLTDAQVTEARNDYLWANYSVICAAQFEQELKNRFEWRDGLLDGPVTAVAAQVPSIGTEFNPPQPPAVPDGILPRWRALVEQLKGHKQYTKAIGADLGIEAPAAPAQRTKPLIRLNTQPGGAVKLNVVKDGHDAVAIYTRRNGETQMTLLGVFTRSRITDARENVIAGQPELRQYEAQYQDGDVAVGERSDRCSASTQP